MQTDHEPNSATRSRRNVFSLAALTSLSAIGFFVSVEGHASSPCVRFYAPKSFWNTTIAAGTPLAPNSAAMVAYALAPYAQGSNFSNGPWGIGYVNAAASNKVYTVACLQYYCPSTPISFPIPQGAMPTSGSDHHLAVAYNGKELDMWAASYNASNDTWSAGSVFVGNLHGWGANAAPGQRAGGAVAAGYSVMGGVVRPEEIAQGYIGHALSVMIPNPGSPIVGPATATDGRNSNPNAIPEGAHIQLDPTFDVNSQPWPAWEKMIAKALQTYGAYVSDTGGSIAFYGQTDNNAGNTSWSSVGVPSVPRLSNLPWSRMRVLNLSIVPKDTVK